MSEPLFDVAAPGVPATERDMLDLLHKRYGQQSYNGAVQADRYVRAEHVRARAGFDCGTADFVAVDTWASSRFAIHGVEVKVSRSDWLRELKDPHKSAPFREWCSYWWLAVPDKDIVHPGELPPGWGLLVVSGREPRLVGMFAAPRQDVTPMPMASVASLLRAVAKTAAARAAAEERAAIVADIQAEAAGHLFSIRRAMRWAAWVAQGRPAGRHPGADCDPARLGDPAFPCCAVERAAVAAERKRIRSAAEGARFTLWRPGNGPAQGEAFDVVAWDGLSGVIDGGGP